LIIIEFFNNNIYQYLFSILFYKVSQSVKEVVESLVADNLINCEKIGIY